jgi:hypothetical protein
MGRTRFVPGGRGGGIPGNGGCTGLAFWRFFSGRGLAIHHGLTSHTEGLMKASHQIRYDTRARPAGENALLARYICTGDRGSYLCQ